MINERETKRIDGQLFDQMIWGGVACLRENCKIVNDLNVFPIPDGDTGENMFLTLKGGFDALKNVVSPSLGEKANAMAQGMLYGARGNSGVILSQLFYGMSQGLSGRDDADLFTFGNALKEGVKRAYGAVIHPVEGTILTVAREAIENAYEKINDDTTVEHFFSTYLAEMKKSLEKTPNLLAVLKEAGVIDSGGAGLVYITEGFCNALGGEIIEPETQETVSDQHAELDYSLFDENSVMTFGYCTEVLLRLQKCKIDIDSFNVQEVIDFLESVGDSVAVVCQGSIVKIHVHTLTPYKVLERLQEYGEYLKVKVENMTLQHNGKEEKEEPKKRERVKYATVTTANGKGLKELFLGMGADAVIEGGQTNNPSSSDFVKSFDEVNADVIFVLPNNSNIVMAAEQAASMYEGSEVIVIKSKNIGEGYSAIAMLDYSKDNPQEIAEYMKESMSGTVTGMVTRAIRNACIDGVEVTDGNYIGFIDKKMLASKKSKIETSIELLEKLNAGEHEYVIACYGASATAEERQTLKAEIVNKFSGVEVYEIEGEQEVYDFVFILE